MKFILALTIEEETRPNVTRIVDSVEMAQFGTESEARAALNEILYLAQLEAEEDE